MVPRRLLSAPCVLEVERKFRALAVRELTQHGGDPHFQSLRKLPPKRIRDTYYDRTNILSSAGAWVRRRNGGWEAKIRKGGDFTNSRFEELTNPRDIAAYVQSVTGAADAAASAGCNFGLAATADFCTRRETWIADGEFRIVLDAIDFGHEVGEVELQLVLAGVGDEEPGEARKQEAAAAMDERVEAFMKRYAWAFAPGEPKGKLTAYFEKFNTGRQA
ncbi:hypothetical protein BHE90_013701 [Fusarium euwallaceae]|uniref:Uncharacterized protein n=1 Tax=Fusarium euwallaceae TaxID=1147111 RepID=A0A430L8A5_9HYPO|nr:hypothetical protein BHE90_013701 [Fusarium euwallaceae]